MSSEPVTKVIQTGDKVSLCQCGHSKKFPFCDGSHRQVNEAEGTDVRSLKVDMQSEDRVVQVCAGTTDENCCKQQQGGCCQQKPEDATDCDKKCPVRRIKLICAVGTGVIAVASIFGYVMFKKTCSKTCPVTNKTA
ncbi:MAG: hypothetical protein MHM6MM_006285 [Cercozoa sp. M6MM]